VPRANVHSSWRYPHQARLARPDRALTRLAIHPDTMNSCRAVAVRRHRRTRRPGGPTRLGSALLKLRHQYRARLSLLPPVRQATTSSIRRRLAPSTTGDSARAKDHWVRARPDAHPARGRRPDDASLPGQGMLLMDPGFLAASIALVVRAQESSDKTKIQHTRA
jgi:hypothetical protein